MRTDAFFKDAQVSIPNWLRFITEWSRHPHHTIQQVRASTIRIFGSKSLADIDNIRLQKQKEKTLSFNFDIKHLEGIKNHADAFTRYPVNAPDEDDLAEAKEIKMLSQSTVFSLLHK